MASACVNNVGVSSENFPTAGKFPPYGCFSPRASFGREDGRTSSAGSGSGLETKLPKATEETAEIQDACDFEFRLEDPVGMLPADELFSDGKLVPLQVSCSKQQPSNALTERRWPDGKCRRMEMEMEMEISGTDPYLFSPKAPRCSSRWRELLGLKRFSQTSKTTSSVPSNPRSSSSSLKHFLHRSSRSCSSCSGSSSDASSLSLPLLKDSDCESLSITSSRLSLSSSSSGHDHEDLPRLSLDSERPNPNLNLNPNLSPNPFAPARSLNPNPPRMRLVKPRDGNHASSGTGRVGRSPIRRAAAESSSTVMSRGVSVDSPRLNSSGKIVFQSLERSSSSPSSFNGGTSGYRHRGMERSYSANVRVTPVLNVPVCSLRGGSKSGLFGQFFSSSSSSSSSSSQQQKTGNGTNRVSHHQHCSGKNRNSTDRI